MNYLKIFMLEVTTRLPHGHEDLEIGILMDGSLNLFLEDGIHVLSKGDIYIMNRYQVHSFTHTHEKNLILAFQIDSKFYRRLNPSLNYVKFHDYIVREDSCHDMLYDKLLSCACYYFDQKNNYALHCGSILLDILSHIFSENRCIIISEKEHFLVQNNTARLNRIIEYIAEHYSEKISLKQIADMENITECHASHFIRKMLGISFQDYLNSIRFEHALRLINHSDFSILDICLETGFSSSRYLNKMFEKRLGCTVKEYLRMQNKTKEKTIALPADNIQNIYGMERSATILHKQKDSRNQPF